MVRIQHLELFVPMLAICMSLGGCGPAKGERPSTTAVSDEWSASSGNQDAPPRMDGLTHLGTWCKENVAPFLVDIQLPPGSGLSGHYLTTNVVDPVADSPYYPGAAGKCYIGFTTANEEQMTGDQVIVIFGVGDLRSDWQKRGLAGPESVVYSDGMTFASKSDVTPHDASSLRHVNSSLRAAAIMRSLVDWKD